MPRKSTHQADVTRVQSQGVYCLPAGGVLTEIHLAAFLGSTRRVVLERLIYPEDHDGLPCVPLGGRFLTRVSALDQYIKRHEQPQERPRRKGSRRCAADPPNGKSV